MKFRKVAAVAALVATAAVGFTAASATSAHAGRLNVSHADGRLNTTANTHVNPWWQ